MSKVEDLLKSCNEKIREYKYWLAWWSFRNNFEETKELISDDFNNKELDDSELKQFIEICDNRLERAKTFLNDVAIVLGFDFAALAIVASIGNRENVFYTLLPFSGYIIVASLFIILVLLFVLLAHYRSHVHAWTAFKEKAILMKVTQESPLSGARLTTNFCYYDSR